MNEKQLRLVGASPSHISFASPEEYRTNVDRIAKWADADGWEAILIYTDHKQLDPWLVAQTIIQSTENLRPLVAVQPVYMHPFTLAQNIISLAYLYGRQVHLNLVAGGFPRDLETLGDQTPHDRRYDRVVEYANIVMSLLCKQGLTTFTGEFYRVKDLILPGTLPDNLRPGLMVSGSSTAGAATASKLQARAIRYLRPAEQYTPEDFDASLENGTRMGVIVRDSDEEAWEVAHRRYPSNPQGAVVRQYIDRLSDSVWIKELGKDVVVPPGHPYWLGPYKNSQTACPFLVGSFERVTRELVAYIRLGLTTFLLEMPESAEDSRRITGVFKDAWAQANISEKYF